jgi:hypothetical protein
MSSVDLKSNIHKIIDRIQNEQLLQTLYDFLKIRESHTPGEIWNTLNEEQKKELLLSYDESEDENNLVDRNKVFKKSE